MTPKLAKTIVKTATSIAFSLLLGYTYKVGKKLDARIDDHYAEPPTDQDN